MGEIPDALVEKAALALAARFGEKPDADSDARAVLEAVWDDLPAARPVVDRPMSGFDRLRGPSSEAEHPLPSRLDETVPCTRCQDAADVRRAVAEEIAATARELRATLLAQDEWTKGYIRGVEHVAADCTRIARDVAASPAHPATPATTHPQPEEGR
jgi:hypothetical protein